jgi:deoxyribose-phosphate aldolase
MSVAILRQIDHAVLQPTQTAGDVRAACQLCLELGTASVCVKPSHVRLAAELLAGSAVVVSTVIGFPHGGTSTASKLAEAAQSCQDGAVELDMVINLGWALGGELEQVEAEIAAVVAAARAHGAMTKVIFETGLLPNDDLKRQLCQASERAGAAFVKTSTGFGMLKHEDGHLVSTGATEHDVFLMRESCGPSVGVKASGGIRNLSDAQRMIAAGATRLGTSATAQIAKEVSRQSSDLSAGETPSPTMSEY